jgi:hypothetical protein
MLGSSTGIREGRRREGKALTISDADSEWSGFCQYQTSVIKVSCR